MKAAILLVFWTIFGLIGLAAGLAGNFVGWFFVLLAVGSIVGTLSSKNRSDQDKEEQSGNGVGSYWDLGGCSGGGCGGCGGCGG
jgi:hypothetical protein